MKKLFIAMMAGALGMLLLAGCDTNTLQGVEPGPGPDDTPAPAEPTAVEIVEEKYGKLGEATSVGQSIEILGGTLVQYESQKTYTKDGDAYKVTGTVKKLNALTAETPYSETTVNETVSAGKFEGTLDFDPSYYSAVKVENGVFEGQVNDGSVVEAFGLEETLPAPVHGVTLTIATDETHVTSIGITYASGASAVTILLTFTY